MDCVAILISQLQWMADVSMATVSDMCPINFYTVFYWLLILTVMNTFLLVFALMVNHTMILFAHVYKYFYGLSNTSTDDNAWDKFRDFVTHTARFYGRLFHGFEIEGIENIPLEGGALLVVYHGLLPMDIILFICEVYRITRRQARLVVDRQFFNFPTFGLQMRLLKATPGTIETCSNVLKDGHLMMVAPGGDYEWLFGDNNYRLLWRNRLGYAKVAIEAKSPIIPVFTVNIGDAYRSLGIGRSWRKASYPKWRLLNMILILGGWPVKLRTIVGKPIPYDPALTADELNRKVMMSMEQLIKDNQRVPGSIVMALLDRFKCPKKVKGT